MYLSSAGHLQNYRILPSEETLLMLGGVLGEGAEAESGAPVIGNQKLEVGISEEQRFILILCLELIFFLVVKC